MQNIRYTTDGRKVLIIEQLNDNDIIVQEIYVKDGKEFPNGNKFAIKSSSLRNEQLISWKQHDINRIEQLHKTKVKDYNVLIEQLNTKMKELEIKLNYINKSINNVNSEPFELLADFLCGKIKFVVVDDDYSPQILPIEKFHTLYDNQYRIISIFGKDNGSFTFGRGEYSDTSGSKKIFKPFKEYDEAFEYFTNVVKSKKISDTLFKIASEFNIQLDNQKLIKYKIEKVDYHKKMIDNYKNLIIQSETNIDNINKL